MPRNVQKDPESSLTWLLKDEVLRRGNVYYAKLIKGRSTFVARRLVPYFNALLGMRRSDEDTGLTPEARAVLRALRKEWEMATADLREAAGFEDRKITTRALDELQKAMKVLPSEVLYEPWFTYIWMLSAGRFQKELSRKVSRPAALKEIARAFLIGAGMTFRGELARVAGLSRPDAGLGNQALVAEGSAEQVSTGVYRLTGFEKRMSHMLSITGFEPT